MRDCDTGVSPVRAMLTKRELMGTHNYQPYRVVRTSGTPVSGSRLSILLIALIALGITLQLQAADPAVLTTEFIADAPPTPSCHAATVAELTDGTLTAAWFGGTAEGNKDVGIWFARRSAAGWSTPVELANGKLLDGSREPCWNPVLYQVPTGPLLLFYKMGPSPRTWYGRSITSNDGGLQWSAPQELPTGILGPIKDKPILLSDGAMLCPTSSEEAGWRVYFERTTDLGKTWTRTDFLNDGKGIGAIQPTLLDHGSAGLQTLCRTKQGKIAESWSHDLGKTWEPLALTSLPNPNSGIDAVQLKDGRSVLIYNHTPKGRSPLNLAIASDGKQWQAAPVLETEPGEYSYPAIIQTSDGMVHAVYTWKRKKIRHVVLDPSKFKSTAMPVEK